MALTTEQKIANSFQLDQEDCKHMVKKTFNLMRYIVTTYGEELIDSKMMKEQRLDDITKWIWDVGNSIQLEYQLEKLNSSTTLSEERKKEIELYAVRRVYNNAYSSICEYIIGAISDEHKKQREQRHKTIDVYIYEVAYDIKMVDWQEGYPQYVVYRDYGQRKLWICVKSKSSLADIDELRSLINYLKKYLLENKELIIEEQPEIKIRGDVY